MMPRGCVRKATGLSCESHAEQVMRQSRLFETAPEGVTDQPPFINAAMSVRTQLDPLQLLATLKEVEVGLAAHTAASSSLAAASLTALSLTSS